MGAISTSQMTGTPLPSRGQLGTLTVDRHLELLLDCLDLPLEGRGQVGAITAERYFETVPDYLVEQFGLPLGRRYSVKDLLTSSGQDVRQNFLSADQEDQKMLTQLGSKHKGQPIAQAALSRLSHLETLQGGWDGTDTAAPIHEAIKDAKALAVKLVHEGVELMPRIGLDSDGTVSFLFVRERDGFVLGEVSILGDGTYSYFAEADGRVAARDGARIGWPVPKELTQVLTG